MPLDRVREGLDVMWHPVSAAVRLMSEGGALTASLLSSWALGDLINQKLRAHLGEFPIAHALLEAALEDHRLIS